MALWAMRLLRVSLRQPVATTKILSKRDCFKVLRIYTATVSAQMVNLQAVGDRPDKQFVGHPVREKSFVVLR